MAELKFVRTQKSFALRGSERPTALIFAEGWAEACFLEKWLAKGPHDPQKVAIVLVGGDVGRLKNVFANLAQDENFDAVVGFGFFYDAERGAASQTIQVIESLLAKHDIIAKGTKLAGGSQDINGKKIGIFVSPDNKSPGWIEDIVLHEIATTDLKDCLDQFSALVHVATRQAVHSKTITQAFIGIRTPGVCGTGHGFNNGQLDVMHPAYEAIRSAIAGVL